MPSTSPGETASSPPTPFAQVLPGAPNSSLQAVATFIFRHKRYVAYVSGRQLNILSSPNSLVEAITFTDELVAIAAESHTGKIAVAGKSDVYALEPVVEGWTKVWWEKALYLQRGDSEDEAKWLSWGNEGELLVGGSRLLSLFSTLPSSRTSTPASSPVDGEEVVEERTALWSKSVASPVQYAAFSPSASLIATCGVYDRLVKIWRRLSFEEGLFDHTYLPHPGAVAHVQWRPQDNRREARRGSGINGRHEDDPEVLYTIANDGVLRIWRTGTSHDLEILTLHTTVDLVSAIPHSPTLTVNGGSRTPRPVRYVFMLACDDFCGALNTAVGRQTDGKLSNALEHLKEIASDAPDVVVALDGQGRMSAWGLRSIGHKRRPETPGAKQAFHIAHAEDLLFKVPNNTNMRFEAWFEDDSLQLIAHSFDGQVRWWRGNVETFFSPSEAGTRRLALAAAWSGHTSNVQELRSSRVSNTLVSLSNGSGVVCWTLTSVGEVVRGHSFTSLTDVLEAVPYGTEGVIATLHSTQVILWNAKGTELARIDHEMNAAEGLQMFKMRTEASLLIVTGAGKGVLVSSSPDLVRLRVHRAFVLSRPSDAVQQNLHIVYDDSGTRRPSATRGVIVTLNTEGLVCRTNVQTALSAGYEELESVPPGAIFDTEVEDASAFSANTDVAALAMSDGKAILILDLMDGYREHREHFPDPVKLLQCFSTSPDHNFLAVAFIDSIRVMAQGRFEHHTDPPPWTTVKAVSIAGLGLRISAMEWLLSGSLVVGAGNGLMVTDHFVSAQALDIGVQVVLDISANSEKTLRLSALGRKLQRPLPVWHPSLLLHLVHSGETEKALRLLRQLGAKLKFWSEGEELHPVLDTSIRQLTAPDTTQAGELDEEFVKGLAEQLDEKDLPEMSQIEQQRLKRMLETFASISEHMRGLDKCALRYLFSWKLLQLQMEEAVAKPNGAGLTNGASHDEQTLVPQMKWREIAFAYHSATQQPLLDILVLHYDNKLTWPMARALGFTTWLSDREALAQVFESLAQSAYRESSPPDPSNASLFFLALHKKATLLALWRIATWHKEQRATLNFLKRDFSQPDAKTAAKKNAYALMGKRRFQYAAAFFLLADDAASAVSLLAGQCQDMMLAIAVARLHSGDQSAALGKLVDDRLLPQAMKEGNRWLASWSHSILSQKQEAADVLVKPLHNVRDWHQDDPTTLMLYRELRVSSSEYEYAAVLRAARLLRRMGLWLLALELVRNWQFRPPGPAPQGESIVAKLTTTNGVHHEPPSMLDSSGEDNATTPPAPMSEKAAREAKAAELLQKLKAKKEAPPIGAEKKPPPTQLKEPDANSLLDSFGF